MRKLWVWFITIMVASSFVEYAYAISQNDFTFAGDLQFGYTINETEKLLRKNHIEYTVHDLYDEPNSSHAIRSEKYGMDTRWLIFIEDFRVAGYTADGYLYYNLDDTLSDVEYFFYADDEASNNNTYSAVESLLQKQYGNTEYSSATGKKLNLKVSHLPLGYTARGTWAETMRSFDIIDYSERLVSTDDKYDVAIQHFNYKKYLVTTFYTTNDSTNMDVCETKVSYSLCPKETAAENTGWGL